ncbi:hypothetical protein HY374_01190 [Candidatus Berkelbacteria bacterium]|nr:hypothetical protein [Candidatus Berkelbacteria bacterium]
MERILGILFSLILLIGSPAWAQEVKQSPEWQISIGSFGEGDTGRYDYGVLYTVLSGEVEGQPLRVQYDWFSNPSGFQRVWLNYGELPIVDGDEFKFRFRPGVIVANDGRWWGGGFLQSEIPALRLSTNWKSAWGPSGDRHLWFTNVAITDEVGVSHMLYMQQGYEPDSYLGPYVNLGDVYLWGGPSLTRPGAWSVNIEAPVIRF